MSPPRETDAKGSIDELRQAAIQAGADTAFSASEAAQGIEELLKAGVSTADVLGGGLKGSLDLAAAGDASLAKVQLPLDVHPAHITR